MHCNSALGLMVFVIGGIAACKPPPTDAGLDREMPVGEPTFASEPLLSPDTKGAGWAPSAEPGRIIYGIPGQPALVALECIERAGQSQMLRVTRLAPADEGASALMALIGNGSIGRLEVEAAELGNRHVWQGEAPAEDTVWEPLNGPRQLTVTVPGAGMVTINPSRLPEDLLAECRGLSVADAPVPPAAKE